MIIQIYQNSLIKSRLILPIILISKSFITKYFVIKVLTFNKFSIIIIKKGDRTNEKT